ncbi:hypothetical protein B0H15DRAFT_773529 [Mycena belliarum]|uniref:Uncharacterized protein n=1 Tax=Mycena belliarum TaxID=1033014 RepID=A0AAD6UFL8_9AGAR|nr:hypothetical protein B0H15DRAFT_773529 [Mycena belliae]
MYSRNDIATLRRPSQYIGFDKIHRPFPPLTRQFKNHPLVLTQVDSRNGDVVFGEYLKKHAASVGTVYPETRHISTVAQFRAVDYGMEICELHVKLQTAGSSLELYRLEGTALLDSSELTYKNRPKRALMLSEIRTSDSTSTDWRRNFTCHSEQLLTFELVCAPGSMAGCSFEWWQTPEDNGSQGV